MDALSKQPYGEQEVHAIQRVQSALTTQQQELSRLRSAHNVLETEAKSIRKEERACHALYASKGTTAWYAPASWGLVFGKQSIRPSRKVSPQTASFTIDERDLSLERVKGWYSDQKHKLKASYKRQVRETRALVKETKNLLCGAPLANSGQRPAKRARHAPSQNLPVTSAKV